MIDAEQLRDLIGAARQDVIDLSQTVSATGPKQTLAST
jgi:hypothetical protein